MTAKLTKSRNALSRLSIIRLGAAVLWSLLTVAVALVFSAAPPMLITAVTLTLAAETLGGEKPEIKTSRTIGAVLREPLPAEELRLSENAAEFAVDGPTFTYRIWKSTGGIGAIRVERGGQAVVESEGPANLQIDQYQLASDRNAARLAIVDQGKDKIVFKVEGVLHDPTKEGPQVDFTILHTFFNDGVTVSEVKLSPRADLPIHKSLVYRLPVQGRFCRYIHKRRDENGMNAARGALPEPGGALRLNTLTSCLQVFGTAAGLAIFTDCGATYLSRRNLDSAVLEVTGKEGGLARVSLTQYLVHVAPGDKPFLLKAGEEFRFRVGISVSPNRLPHPRIHDLRMFIWVGDAKHPYPTDEEIAAVAQLGFTLFQMHRAGTPGEPRPPAGEMQRVVAKVHQSGMLLLWCECADGLFTNAPGVRKMKAEGKWPLWQGFNYGGRYTASMDPYCNLSSTCLASPNGLADYRLDCIRRMLDQFPVDGIYLDDNLPYANCTLWKEHGHPKKVYDCLIELHEMNWRRRELMRSRCPHAVLVSHCSRGFFLPTICDFDAQLYGEGYSFGSMENYWHNYVTPALSVPSQGMICSSDDEPERCAATVAYNYDLLTGGGQYSTIDWRLYPKKFPYAAGVTDREMIYVKSYNLAQYYFGLYESKPHFFADSADLFTTTTPLTYAAVYHNRVWGDYLVPIANMSREALTTSLVIFSPQVFDIRSEIKYVLFDVHRRTTKTIQGDCINEAFSEINIPRESLRLFCLRPQPPDAPYHLWGGKRTSEVWNGKTRKLTFTVHGPAGLQETLFIGGAKYGIQQVVVAGKPASFCFDPARGLAYGPVTFAADTLKIEVFCSSNGANGLPVKQAAADTLVSQATLPGG